MTAAVADPAAPLPLTGPAYAFGMRAAVAAIKARGGRMPDAQDVDDLLGAALCGVPGDDCAVDMVRRFGRAAPRGPVAAGAALDRDLRAWRDGALSGEIDRLSRMLDALAVPRVTARHVLAWCAEIADVPIWRITAATKGNMDDVHARWFAAAMMRAHLSAPDVSGAPAPWSLPRIAGVLNRDHSTILHGLRRWDALSSEPWAVAWVRAFEARLHARRLSLAEAAVARAGSAAALSEVAALRGVAG